MTLIGKKLPPKHGSTQDFSLPRSSSALPQIDRKVNPYSPLITLLPSMSTMPNLSLGSWHTPPREEVMWKGKTITQTHFAKFQQLAKLVLTFLLDFAIILITLPSFAGEKMSLNVPHLGKSLGSKLSVHFHHFTSCQSNQYSEMTGFERKQVFAKLLIKVGGHFIAVVYI